MNFLITALVCKAKVQKILWDEGYKAGNIDTTFAGGNIYPVGVLRGLCPLSR